MNGSCMILSGSSLHLRMLFCELLVEDARGSEPLIPSHYPPCPLLLAYFVNTGQFGVYNVSILI
jgi:hypothetical protein